MSAGREPQSTDSPDAAGVACGSADIADRQSRRRNGIRGTGTVFQNPGSAESGDLKLRPQGSMDERPVAK